MISSLSALNIGFQQTISSVFSTKTVASAAIITGVALSALCSNYSQTCFRLIQASACLLSMVVLPKILDSGNERMIKGAVLAMLLANGCLGMGDAASTSWRLGRLLFDNLFSLQFSNTLYYSSLLSLYLWLMEFVIYGSYRCLKNFNFMQKDVFTTRIEPVANYFSTREPGEVVPSFFNKAGEYAAFFGSVFNTQAMYKLYQNFNLRPSEAVRQVMSLFLKLEVFDLATFSDLIEEMGVWSLNYQTSEEDMPAALKGEYLDSVKNYLLFLPDSDLNVAFDLLIFKCNNIVPIIMKREDYLQLLQQECFIELINAKASEFIELMNEFPQLEERVESLNNDSLELEKQLKDQIYNKNNNNLVERYENLFTQLMQIRQLSQRMVELRNHWKQFRDCVLTEGVALPGNHGENFQLILNNMELNADLNLIHTSLLGRGDLNDASSSIRDRLELINNKLLQDSDDTIIIIEKKEEEEDLFEPSQLLATDFNFRADDYNALCDALKVDDPHKIDGALIKLGLKDEESIRQLFSINKEDRAGVA